MTATRALWLEHLPLARFTLNRMKATGELQQPLDDDLLQEARLAVGLAVGTWDPARGTISTWVCARVRYAVLDHLNREANGGVVSEQRRAKLVPLPPDEWEADHGEEQEYGETRTWSLQAPALTYDDPPEGYGDPETAAAAAVLASQVRFALDLLSARDRDVLTALYGLTGPALTLKQYAAKAGLNSHQAASVRREAALQRLRQVMVLEDGEGE